MLDLNADSGIEFRYSYTDKVPYTHTYYNRWRLHLDELYCHLLLSLLDFSTTHYHLPMRRIETAMRQTASATTN